MTIERAARTTPTPVPAGEPPRAASSIRALATAPPVAVTAPVLPEATPPTETMLLLTLGEISRLVSNAHDLEETLSKIVRHIQHRFQTDVCSVYIRERCVADAKDLSAERPTPHGMPHHLADCDLVLRATVGLAPESVGTIRLRSGEGLTGLVAQSKEALAVSNASKHERYRYFPGSGEEQFLSFLGLPMLQGGEVRGVLVIQHRTAREYSAGERSLLLGVAAQLAVLITNAQLTRDLTVAVSRLSVDEEPKAQKVTEQFAGNPASSGRGHGRAVIFHGFDFDDPQLAIRQADSVETELARLRRALQLAREDMQRAAERLSSLLGEQFGPLLQSQQLMLEDAAMQRDVTRLIEAGATAEFAVVEVCNKYLRAFRQLENPYFYERIYDIKDTFRRVLGHARSLAVGVHEHGDMVIVAPEVSMLELFSCDLDRVKGIVIEAGGVHSHVAILARSLNIPMVSNVEGITKSVGETDEIFVDATTGTVWLNPDESRRRVILALEQGPAKVSDPAVMNTKMPFQLLATVNLLPEVARTVEMKGEGVGLYRSEFLELARRSFPTEEEQVDVYRGMLQRLEGRMLTIRSLDLRPDKLYGVADPKFHGERWDWRIVDRLPHVQDLIRTQLRAVLRAAAEGPVRLLFPMIVTDEQFRCALKLWEQAKMSLANEGLKHEINVPVGLMVETPAAAMALDRWIDHVDYVGVGSNDLLHGLLGIGRGDDDVREIKTPLTPSYLRTLAGVVDTAHFYGKPVTVCGDVTSQPVGQLAFYVLGVDSVSVPPGDLYRARELFHGLDLPADPTRLREHLMHTTTAAAALGVLQQYIPNLEDRLQQMRTS